MNSNNPFTGITPQASKKDFSVAEILFKYLNYLPLFIFCIVAALSIVQVYIRYKVPVYKASMQVLVAEDQVSQKSQQQQDLVAQAISGVRTINLENEMEFLKSRNLLEKVVQKGNYNVYYYKEGTIKLSDSYINTPFTCKFTFIADSNQQIQLKIKNLNNEGGDLEYSGVKSRFKWNDTIKNAQLTCILTKNSNSFDTEKSPYTITYNPIGWTIGEFQGGLSVAPLKPKSSILVINLFGQNRKKIEDFLDDLLDELILKDVQQKKEASNNTLKFIDERLKILAKELGIIESDFLNFRKNRRFVDVTSEYGYYQSRVIESEKGLDAWNLEIQIIQLIQEYLTSEKPNQKNKLIPSNLSITDGTFSGMIGNYNALQLRKQALEPNVKADNFLIIDLNNQIKELKTNILAAAANVIKANQLKIKNFQDRKNDDLGKLTLLPDQEKELQEINRQKAAKEKLFNYLLQRSEETSISSISTASNYRKLDPAGSSPVPVGTPDSQLYLVALAIGFVIPLIFVYLLDLFNNKINQRKDVTENCTIPIIAEISFVASVQNMLIGSSRSLVSEQFRVFRSNLEFLLPKNQNEVSGKTILLTSSMSGEGKSFISLNLATVISLSGKKVALLEFDLRKLNSMSIPELDGGESIGISNYLMGQVEDPSTLYKVLPKYPNLHIYRTGPLPYNPAELMIGSQMDNFFSYLKTKYDYIVVDSAPIGLVSDPYALANFSDAVIYVVRQGFTYKQQLETINELKETQKLKNMSLVVNDVKLSQRYGYYGYGYGRRADVYSNSRKNYYFDSSEKEIWWRRILNKINKK
jgi:capsular exopolysaccharide synthesis family protein